MSFLLSNVFLCTVLHCNGNIILEKPLDFMHCVASRFGYPNYRLSELSLVPISPDNRRSTLLYGYKLSLRPASASVVNVSSL